MMQVLKTTPDMLVIDMAGMAGQVVIITVAVVGAVLGGGMLWQGWLLTGLGIAAVTAALVAAALQLRRGNWRLRLQARAGTITLRRHGQAEVLPLAAIAGVTVQTDPAGTAPPLARVVLHFAPDLARPPLPLGTGFGPAPDAARLARVIAGWLDRYRRRP